MHRPWAFVHLHCHSEYSLLDGANRIDDLIARALEFEQPALAITDHGNMHGAWEFQEKAKKAKLKPIIGMEAYVAPGDRRAASGPSPASSPTTISSSSPRTPSGYHNLVKLSSLGYLEGFYTQARVDRELLPVMAKGSSSPPPAWPARSRPTCWHDDLAAAQEAASLVRQRLPGPLLPRGPGARLAGANASSTSRSSASPPELGLPVIATNDAHFLRARGPRRPRRPPLHRPRKGSRRRRPHALRPRTVLQERRRDRRTLPGPPRGALDNTLEIADRADIQFSKTYRVPSFPLPAGVDAGERATGATRRSRGAKNRYGDPLPTRARERLDYELGVITKTGYAGYFLIVADFIKAARDRGIPVGPGRGSAAGSLVAYSLRITDICPLEFDLLFERFLNPERVSMPDIDVDFCFERRGEVIEYVRQKYGRDSVGQIVTFGTLKSRAAIKDVGRTLGFTPAETDALAKLIPNQPNYSLTIKEATEQISEIRRSTRTTSDTGSSSITRWRSKDSPATRASTQRESSSRRGRSTITCPSSRRRPKERAVRRTDWAMRQASGPSDETVVVTQYDMNALEKVGHAQDGLPRLDDADGAGRRGHIDRTRAQATHIDLDALPLDDDATYRMLRSGPDCGVSSSSSRRWRPICCAACDATGSTTSSRPTRSCAQARSIRACTGSTSAASAARSRSRIRCPSSSPSSTSTLRRHHVSGAGHAHRAGPRGHLARRSRRAAQSGRQEGSRADPLGAREVRREGGRPRVSAPGHHRDRGADRDVRTLWLQPQSHSVAYSILSYQTAWLKTHYPADFMAALLSSQIGDTDAVVKYINEAREIGLEVLPPDVNESGYRFTVVGDRRLRFGLGAIRNVGRAAIDSIVAARTVAPFTSLFDLCARVDLRMCNKRVFEALIHAGALDSLGWPPGPISRRSSITPCRRPLSVSTRRLRAKARCLAPTPADDQASSTAEYSAPTLPAMRAIAGNRAPGEGEGRPRILRVRAPPGALPDGGRALRDPHRRTARQLGQRSRIKLAVVVTAIKRQVSKRSGAEFARLTVEDFSGSSEVLVFPEAWAALSDRVRPEVPVLLEGGYSRRDQGGDNPTFIVEAITKLTELRTNGRVVVAIDLDPAMTGPALSPHVMVDVRAVAEAYPGSAPLEVRWSDGNGVRVRFRSSSAAVSASPAALNDLRALLGSERVRLVRAN